MRGGASGLTIVYRPDPGPGSKIQHSRGTVVLRALAVAAVIGDNEELMHLVWDTVNDLWQF